MAHFIKGHTITLIQKVQVGTDPFNQPEYEEQRIPVENVLVSPVSSDDVIEELDLYGKQATYMICIPKGDTHVWENQQVEIFGYTWTVYTFPKEYFDEDLPLDWNKQYYIERFN